MIENAEGVDPNLSPVVIHRDTHEVLKDGTIFRLGGVIQWGTFRYLAENAGELVKWQAVAGLGVELGCKLRYRDVAAEVIRNLRRALGESRHPSTIISHGSSNDISYQFTRTVEWVGEDSERGINGHKQLGDPEEFARLYEENRSRLFKFVLYKVGDPTLAEDLAAETFLRAWEKFGDFEDRDIPVANWLISNASNIVVDHERYIHAYSGNRMFPVSLDIADQEISQLDPGDLVERKIANERLRRVLARLNDSQRDVIIHRFIYGQSHEEIAAELGKSSASARQIQVRALRQLKKLLAEP